MNMERVLRAQGCFVKRTLSPVDPFQHWALGLHRGGGGRDEYGKGSKGKRVVLSKEPLALTILSRIGPNFRFPFVTYIGGVAYFWCENETPWHHVSKD